MSGVPTTDEPRPFGDDVDRRAMEAFAQQYPDAELAPVTVVIAAYNEAKNIGAVIKTMPSQVCGVAVTTLVVDDGSSDGTAEIAREAGAYVCAAPVNRGQGAALRLGYHIARNFGSHIIATTDADGQYEASELPLIVEPLILGEADFVTGSRRLGLYERDDVVRRAGVHVFARVLSLIARRRITDTSNGFRAFNADIVEHIQLDQPQYQATELLISVIYRGFRVLEVGTTMRPRTSGASKKGTNLVYGYRFGRVILRTWLRELKRNRREHRRLIGSTPLPLRTLAAPTDVALEIDVDAATQHRHSA